MTNQPQHIDLKSSIDLALKNPGGIRITEEQELHTIRRKLQEFPEAVQAVVQAAHALRKPVTNLSSIDVESWASRDKVA
jgi:hypothetical protein